MKTPRQRAATVLVTLLVGCAGTQTSGGATVPGAPSGVAATVGLRAVSLVWTAPAFNGGSPILSYAVSISPPTPAAAVTVTGTTASVTGLGNGVTYTFSVSATNAVGTGPTAASGPVTTPDVPGAPTGVVAVPDNQSAALAWMAPASTGGSPITGYAVAITPPASGAVVTYNGTTAVVTALSNGTSYTFTVSAVNAVGTGPASPASAPVTPSAPTGPPTNLVYSTNPASYSVGVAIVANTPSSSGGAVSSYSVLPALPAGLSLNPVTGAMTGVPTTAAATATYVVTATNSVGSTTASISIAVTANGRFPLSISASKNYLVDATGKPFVMQGDAAWSAIAELSEADALIYLNDRQSRGFNTILVNLVEHSFTSHAPNWANANGDVPFNGTVPGSCPNTYGSTSCNDMSKTNDAYFTHVDWFLQQALSRNILVLLAPAYMGYAGAGGTDGWFNDMAATGNTGLTAYGNYIGARYNTTSYPNIIWVNGCDYTPKNPQELSMATSIVNGIKAGGGTQLMTAHWGGEPSYPPYGPSTRPGWIDVDTVYVEAAPHNYQFTVQGYSADNNVRPVFLIESPYEDEAVVSPPAPTTPLQVRSDMYQPMLSGEVGFVFGNDPIWNFWTGPDKTQKNFYASAYAGLYPSWQAALSSPGGMNAGLAAQFFAPLRWMDLVPDNPNSSSNFLTAGYGSWGSDQYVLGAVTPDGHLGLAYFTFATNVTVDMTKMAGTTRAQWFDPSSGNYLSITGSPFPNTGAVTFPHPGNGSDAYPDWVLLLQSP
jgi:hypothetical protein